jgi:hypothetical protein
MNVHPHHVFFKKAETSWAASSLAALLSATKVLVDRKFPTGCGAMDGGGDEDAAKAAAALEEEDVDWREDAVCEAAYASASRMVSTISCAFDVICEGFDRVVCLRVGVV